MTEKELNQIQYLQKEMAFLEKEINELEAEGCQSAEIFKLRDLLYKKNAELRAQQRRIEIFIENIADSRMRMIFRLRHMKGMTWAEIGDEVGYTYEGVRQVYKKELKKLSL